MCLFLCQCHAVLITVTLYYRLKSESVMPPVFLFLKISLAIQGLLQFHTNFRIAFTMSVKSANGNFVIAFNLQKALGSLEILPALTLPIHAYGYLFLFVFNFFYQCLTVFSVQIVYLLVKFIPKYFIVLHVIVNGIVLFLFQIVHC